MMQTAYLGAELERESGNRGDEFVRSTSMWEGGADLSRPSTRHGREADAVSQSVEFGVQCIGLSAAGCDAFEQIGPVLIQQAGAPEGAAEQLVRVLGGGEAFDRARVEALATSDTRLDVGRLLAIGEVYPSGAPQDRHGTPTNYVKIKLSACFHGSFGQISGVIANR
jgi:hypothetical protein